LGMEHALPKEACRGHRWVELEAQVNA
jgi:hypothetical protein